MPKEKGLGLKIRSRQKGKRTDEQNTRAVKNGTVQGNASDGCSVQKGFKFLEKTCLFSDPASSLRDSFLYLVLVTAVILNISEN